MHISQISGLLSKPWIWMISGIVLCSIPAKAQKELPDSEIEVVKHFDARLTESHKIPVFPHLPAADTSGRKYTYEITIANPEITYQPPQIRPLALRPEEGPQSYKGFLRAGYGVPNAALVDVSYALLNSSPLQLILSGHHESAKKEKQLQNFTGVSLNGNYAVSPALDITGMLSYNQDKVNFYGLEEDDDTPYVDPDRTFKTFQAGAGITNSERLRGEINYTASLDFYNHEDNLATKETGLSLRLGADKNFGSLTTPGGSSGMHAIALALTADISTLTDTEQKRSLDNFSLHPSYRYSARKFIIGGGVQAAANQGEVWLFPTVDASFRVSGQRLIAFALIDGGLLKNNFKSLSAYNPFIHQRIDEIANTVHRDYAIGVKGTLGKITYLGKAGFSTLQDLALFAQDRFDYRKFQPLYDDGNLIRIEGEVNSNPFNHFDISVRVVKSIYDLDIEEKAWHLPGLELQFLPKYISSDGKLQVHGGVFIESGVPYLNDFDEVDKLKGRFDISLGADYYFTQHIGAFIQANNLLGNKYERWQRYPTFGINGVAGVLVKI